MPLIGLEKGLIYRYFLTMFGQKVVHILVTYSFGDKSGQFRDDPTVMKERHL
jgi:hypothetical protein